MVKELFRKFAYNDEVFKFIFWSSIFLLWNKITIETKMKK